MTLLNIVAYRTLLTTAKWFDINGMIDQFLATLAKACYVRT